MGESQKPARTRVQIWTQNYEPEPQGIGPISATVARGFVDHGIDVLAVSAHPHYPQPDWGVKFWPYRERRSGVRVLRLPIWPGRGSGMQRIRQDLSTTAVNTAAIPFLPGSDVVLAISPSLPALFSAMLYSRIRRVPWVLWLQDIVTDGASTTGELSEDNVALKLAKWFERRAYASAARIIVISDAMGSRLREQGVPAEKIVHIFNPMTRTPPPRPADIDRLAAETPKIIVMGNIGRTQGLEAIVDAFQTNEDLERMGAELTIAGTGVAAESVRSRIRTDRISMPGVVDDQELKRLLENSTLALVSQKADLQEFNLPSKLMNYMAHGIPVIASIDPASEAAGIVTGSGAGWVTDPADPAAFARKSALVLKQPDDLKMCAEAGYQFAAEHFSASGVTQKVEDVLRGLIRND
ncbi:MAG: glycosyltransferase family 4 protein [Solirubrobacterales bacterium]